MKIPLHYLLGRGAIGKLFLWLFLWSAPWHFVSGLSSLNLFSVISSFLTKLGIDESCPSQWHSVWLSAKQFRGLGATLCHGSMALCYCYRSGKGKKTCSCQWSIVLRSDRDRFYQGCFMLGRDFSRLLFFLLTECF